MTTKTAKEALDLLRKTRKALIEEGREIAKRIIKEEGSVHARRVREEMLPKIKAAGVKDYWLGAVFNSKEFEWTGEWHQVDTYGGSNFHGPIGIRVWRLR